MLNHKTCKKVNWVLPTVAKIAVLHFDSGYISVGSEVLGVTVNSQGSSRGLDWNAR